MANSERISLRTKFGYGTGHIMNDMCASMWFTYCLLFFNKVLEFDNDLSGNSIVKDIVKMERNNVFILTMIN